MTNTKLSYQVCDQKKKTQIFSSICDKTQILKISSANPKKKKKKRFFFFKIKFGQKEHCQMNFARKKQIYGSNLWQKVDFLKSILRQKLDLQVKFVTKRKFANQLWQKADYFKSNLQQKANCQINFRRKKTDV